LGRKGVIIGFGIVAVVAGIVGLSFSYNNLRQAQQENTAAQADLKQKCQEEKDAVINLAKVTTSTDPNLLSGLDTYNKDCSQLTGGLTLK
jgi:hypothetical protein